MANDRRERGDLFMKSDGAMSFRSPQWYRKYYVYISLI